jgi:hypothetical protein
MKAVFAIYYMILDFSDILGSFELFMKSLIFLLELWQLGFAGGLAEAKRRRQPHFK